MSVRQTRKSKLAAALFFKRVVRGQNARDGKDDTQPASSSKSRKQPPPPTSTPPSDDTPQPQPAARGRKKKHTPECNVPKICKDDAPCINDDCNKNCMKDKKQASKQNTAPMTEKSSKKQRKSAGISDEVSDNVSKPTSLMESDKLWSHDKHFTCSPNITVVIPIDKPTITSAEVKPEEEYSIPESVSSSETMVQSAIPASISSSAADEKVPSADPLDSKLDTPVQSDTTTGMDLAQSHLTSVDIEYPCKRMSQVMYLALSGLALSTEVAEMRKNAAGSRLHRNVGGKLRRVLKPCMKPGMVYQPQSPVRSRTQLVAPSQVDSTVKRQLQLSSEPAIAAKHINYMHVPSKSYMKVPERKVHRHSHHCESKQIKDRCKEDANKLGMKHNVRIPVKKRLEDGKNDGKNDGCHTSVSKLSSVTIKMEPPDDKAVDRAVEGSRRSARQKDGKRKEWWHLLRAAPDEYAATMKHSDNIEQTTTTKVKVEQACRQLVKIKSKETILQDVPKGCKRKATGEANVSRKKKRRKDKSETETDCQIIAVEKSADANEILLSEQIKLVPKDVNIVSFDGETRTTSDGRIIPTTNMHECIIPHMCSVCWVNDHMYCRHMKRVARDLPPCGGCIHYMPCVHFRQIREAGGVYSRSGRPLKVEAARCASDLLCDEEMPESDSDGAGSPGGIGTDLLNIELRARRAQLAAAANDHSNDPEGHVTVADYAAEVVVSDVTPHNSSVVCDDWSKTEPRVRSIQALPAKFCIRVQDRSEGHQLVGQGVVKVERLAEGRFLLEADGVHSNEPPEEVHMTLGVQPDGQMCSDVVGEAIAQQALNLLSAAKKKQLLILTPCYSTTRRRHRKRTDVTKVDKRSDALDSSVMTQYRDECSRVIVTHNKNGSQFVECSSMNSGDNSRTVMPLLMERGEEQPMDLRVGKGSACSRDQNTLHFTTHDVWRRIPRLITKLKQCNMLHAIRTALKAQENNITNSLVTNNNISLGMKGDVEEKQRQLNGIISDKMVLYNTHLLNAQKRTQQTPEQIDSVMRSEEHKMGTMEVEHEVITRLLLQMKQHLMCLRDQRVPAVHTQHSQKSAQNSIVEGGVTTVVPTAAHTTSTNNYAMDVDSTLTPSNVNTCSNDELNPDILSMAAAAIYGSSTDNIALGIMTDNMPMKLEDLSMIRETSQVTEVTECVHNNMRTVNRVNPATESDQSCDSGLTKLELSSCQHYTLS